MIINALKRVASTKRGYQALEIALLISLAVVAALCVWVFLAPKGPVGNWRAFSATAAMDTGIVARFDPFFPKGQPTGGAGNVVTNLPIKLFGVRLDQAIGRGSAIIATPDGIQSSFAVGDQILPGVILKSVTFEGAMISRNGVDEQIFLDQSVAAGTVDVTGSGGNRPVQAAPAPTTPPQSVPPPPPPPAARVQNPPVSSVPSKPVPLSDANPVFLREVMVRLWSTKPSADRVTASVISVGNAVGGRFPFGVTRDREAPDVRITEDNG